jgi:hypothetical protein
LINAFGGSQPLKSSLQAGVGYDPQGLSYKAFILSSHPDHKYIFMIRVTRQMKCLIAHALWVIPHPLPEVNFLMVEIPTPKPYIEL